MTPSPNDISTHSAMDTFWGELRAKAAELGLTLRAFDAAGLARGEPIHGTDFCGALCAAGPSACRTCYRELAREVLRTGRDAQRITPIGCCLLGLPVRDHRRVVGAVVAGFPTREMRDEEALARLCDRMELDRQVVRTYARRDLRHSQQQASDIVRVLRWMLHDAQKARETSQAVTSLSTNLASSYEGLNLLFRLSGSMQVSQDPKSFLEDVCRQMLDVMDIEMTAAMVYGDGTQWGGDLFVRAGRDTIEERALQLLAGAWVAPRLAENQSQLVENHFDGANQSIYGEPVQNLIAVPLVVEKKHVGMFLGLNKAGKDFDSFDVGLMNAVANQTSVFLENSRMYAQLRDLLMGVLHSLTDSIDAKDPYTCGHSRRVAKISRRLAQARGLPPERVQHIYLAGLLHDVGKIGVPEAVLLKEGRLTDEEYESIKQHPGIGAKILRRIPHLTPIVSGVLTHHERPDGTGYPDGLTHSQIPIEGLIIGLSDCWDAMTTHRTYRRALGLEEARSELRRCAGTQFDATLVEIFLSWDLESLTEELNAIQENDLVLTRGLL